MAGVVLLFFPVVIGSLGYEYFLHISEVSGLVCMATLFFIPGVIFCIWGGKAIASWKLPIIHQWGDWEHIGHDQCKQKIICKRCGKAMNEREDHDWGGWEYLRESECTQQSVCRRCRKVQVGEAHDWGGWEYLRESECTQQSVCRRCRKVQIGEAHDWEGYDDGTYDLGYTWHVSYCRRCGARVSS